MLRKLTSLSLLLAMSLPGLLWADELTQMVQQDLATLGYDPGEANGELTTKTIVAVSKFQAEHDLEVTGEVTPQLVGIVKASLKEQSNPAGGTAAAPAVAATRSPEELQAAQQACIQDKVAKAQASQKKKRGFGSLMRAVTRTASQLGNSDVANDIAQTSSDVYNVNATAADLESAAKDLGISESDLEACRNP
ncbi:MAG TPA: peptidoglycan-binding domain-containing protein [Woeseiaceae bacterium]|nr:peptidoglycan-binding domain-containing protein [Woeseiaceae bacterium]